MSNILISDLENRFGGEVRKDECYWEHRDLDPYTPPQNMQKMSKEFQKSKLSQQPA